MKTITCRAMGGTCDEALHADTQEGMMMAGTEHLKVAHPEMAAQVAAMPKDDPMMVAWNTNFQKTWAETPDM